jgi:hypothetical protein
MPLLEILDIRRNKIKRFPSHPGNLVNLRVRWLWLLLFLRPLISTLGPLYVTQQSNKTSHVLR